MAYNPFDFFRRNQKSFFAVLTAFVMVMFVLSFGQGDIFTWLPQMLRSKRCSGPVIATVDGRKVYASDIDRRKGDRILANQFMALANQSAANAVAKELQDGVNAAGERTKNTLSQLLRLRRTGYLDEMTLRILEIRQVPITAELIAGVRQESLRQLAGSTQAILADPTTSKDDLTLAKAAQTLLKLDAAAGGGGYFANQPITEQGRGQFEFDLWLRKADQLGVGITAADAPRMAREEFFNRVPEKDWVEIERSLRDRPGYSQDRLFAALADEFRVRAAQAAVLGPTTPAGPLQAFVAPYEEYQFYKEQVATGTYAVLAVPVANYLDQVSTQPSDGELRELFAKYRDKEPNPSAETPGFRKPRELKVAWAEVKGDEPYYQQAADAALAAAEAQARAAFLLAAPLGGGASLSAVTAPVLGTLPDPALQAAYDQYRRDVGFRTDLAWSWSPFQGGQQVVDNSMVKPNVLATAAGAAAGMAATRGSPFTPLLVFSERVKAEDRNDRARAMVTLLAPGGNLLGAATAAAARLPAPLPLAVMRPELTRQVKKRLAERLAGEDVNRFLTDTAKLAAKKDKSEARTAIDRFLAERGLKHGESAAFHDFFTIEQDPGLKPLVEKRDRAHPFQEEKPLFGQSFFVEADRSDPTRPRAVPAKTMFAPVSYPNGLPFVTVRGADEPEYIFWRTAEVPAETPKSLDDVRAKVVAAWKEDKARELARQAAERLQARVQDELKKEPGGTQSGVVNRVVRDLHTQYAVGLGSPEKANRASFFLVSGVAPLPDRPVSTGMPGQEQYQPWQLRPRPEMQYPSQAMHDALLAHKDDPFGTALVLPDRPKDTFYVAVLQDRAEKDSTTFYTSVYSPNAMFSELPRMLQGRERDEAARHAREQALALLMAEFKVANLNADRLDKGGGDSGD